MDSRKNRPRQVEISFPSNQETFYKILKSGRFADMVKETVKGQPLGNSKEIFNVIKPLAAENDDVEGMWFFFFDAKNRTLALEKMFEGTLSSAMVYPREVVKRAIEVKAAAIAMAHNHPSGDSAPSSEDFAITRSIQAAMIVMGITLHDHVVVGNDSYYSFADFGDIARNGRDLKRLLDGGV